MIDVSNVTKRYGPVTALRGVSLQVPTGRTVAVLGPNGSGKSTLLRLVAGLTPPGSGAAWLDGTEPRKNKARIGFLGHRPYLYPYLSAEENLRFYAGLYGVGPGRVKEVLDFMQLTAKNDALLRTFSKGEAQRLGIARTILHAPDYLILDEPFSGLDEAGAERLIDYLSKSPQTTLMATHDPVRAERVVDAFVHLEAGRLL
ncbi:MAG: ABC transporter ATP-binding protein [Actinomycetota bacterium]